MLANEQESSLLKKLNGNYQPSEQQKKQKSTMQLKRQKALLKIDYVIIPTKGWQSGFLWHFQKLFRKLQCRKFIFLKIKKEEGKYLNQDRQIEIKRKIMSLLLYANGPSHEETIEIMSFSEHLNKRTSKTQESRSSINEQEEEKLKKQNSEKEEIYESQLMRMISELNERQMEEELSQNSLRELHWNGILDRISPLLDTIRNDKLNHPPQLQLSELQLQYYKNTLSQQLRRISEPFPVVYPTDNQQLSLIFLPKTSMLIFLHKHEVMLVNPCNLVVSKMKKIGIPVTNIKYLILTRFSMSWIELILFKNAQEKNFESQHEQSKERFEQNGSLLTIATRKSIYLKIKSQLKLLFLWTDEMIRSRVSFRVLPELSNISELNSRREEVRYQSLKEFEYQVGFVKLSFIKESFGQEWFKLRFGDKILGYANQLNWFTHEWIGRHKLQYFVFDQIKEQVKSKIYEYSNIQAGFIRKKLIHNRSTNSKYGHIHFYQIKQNNPVITITSLLQCQETFVPYFEFYQQTQERYTKVILLSGEVINCRERNIVLIEGLCVGLKDEVIESQEDKNGKKTVTKLDIIYPAAPNVNGNIRSWNDIKITGIDQLLCLKQAIILVQEVQNQIFYENIAHSQQSSIQHSQSFVTQHTCYQGSKNQSNRPKTKQYLSKSQLSISSVESNSLVKLLSKTCELKNVFAPKEDMKQKIEGMIELNSDYYEFNRLFTKVSFQSGQLIDLDNEKVYFVIKGCLKWKSSTQKDPKALNNYFISNIKPFLMQKISQELQNDQVSNKNQDEKQSFTNILGILHKHEKQPLQVVKDTWALEASVLDLYNKFLVNHPQVLDYIISNERIFI